MSLLPIALVLTAAATVIGWASSTGDPVHRWEADNPDPERGDNPPPWAVDLDTWERARETVEPGWADQSDPWATVTHVYKQMGGRIG